MTEIDPLIGRVVGSYRIDRKLGAGGMGAVYLAVSDALEGKSVVIKVLQPEFAANAEIAQRFLNEARAAARISHENVVEVREVGAFVDGRQYIVMEHLAGQDLAHYIARRGPLPLPTMIAIAAQACRGVQAGHDKGILHRDLKPENIFILADEPARPRTVKVLDFGLAKVSDSGVRTRTHAVAGTPGYMAPEQAMGLGLATPRSDVFALGCIVFQMLTARVAWSEETIAFTGASPESPPNPKAFRPDLSDSLAVAVQLAMAFDSRMRPPTPRDLVKRLVEATPGAAEIVRIVADDMVTATAEAHTWLPPSSGTSLPPGTPASGLPTAGTQLAAAVSQAPAKIRSRAGWLIPVAVLAVGGGVAATVIATSGHGRDAASADTSRATIDAATVATARMDAAPPPVAVVAPDAPASANVAVPAQPDAGAPPDAAQLVAATPPDAGVAEVATHGGHGGTPHHGGSGAVAAVDGTGLIKVTVTKTYAMVTVDGTSIGSTPVTRSLSVGRHRVKLENPDLGKSDNLTVTIKKDQTFPVERDW